MSFTLTKKEKLYRAYDIEISAAQLTSKITSKLETLAKEAKLSGFRPGKVPVSVIKSRYGKSVEKEGIEELLNEELSQLLKEESERPAFTPSYVIEKNYVEGEPLKVSVSYEVLPEVSEPDYTALSFTRCCIEVSDEAVDKSLMSVAHQYGEDVAVKNRKTVKEKDIIELDFSGFMEGKPVPNTEAKGFKLTLGEGRFIPDFEKKLLGVAVGTEVSLPVVFPENYSARDLAGKTVDFTVTVHNIMQRKAAKIDDDLAKKTQHDSLAAMKDDIRRRLAKEYERTAYNHLKQDVLKKLDSLVSFDVPEKMVHMEYQGMQEELLQSVPEEEKKAEKEKREEEWRKKYWPIAQQRVRLGVFLAEIARIQGIDVSQKELSDVLLREAQRYPGQEAQVIEYYKSNAQALSSLKAPMLEEKVIDFIISKAKIDDNSLSYEAFLALQERSAE